MKNSILRLFAILFLISFAISSTASAAELKTYRDDSNHFSIKLIQGTKNFTKNPSTYGNDVVMLAAKKGGILSHSNIPATMIIRSDVEFEQTDDSILQELSNKYDQIIANGVEGIDFVRIEQKEVYELKYGNSLFAKSLVVFPDDKKNIYAHCYHFIFGENYKLYQIFYIIPAENEQKYQSQVFESIQSFTLDS